MKLVFGRGNKREVYELPCAELIKRADNTEAETLIANVSALILVSK